MIDLYALDDINMIHVSIILIYRITEYYGLENFFKYYDIVYL